MEKRGNKLAEERVAAFRKRLRKDKVRKFLTRKRFYC
jgi:hypothetical protein